MKTVIYKNVDGFDIIVGFDKALVDSVGTKKKLKKKLEKSIEARELRVASSSYYSFLNKKSDKDEILKRKNNLKEKKRLFDNKVESITKEVLTFHHSKKGEKLITKEEFEALKVLFEKASKIDNLITLDKKEIVDRRNKGYFLKNGTSIESHTIKNINIEYPEGAILELSEEDKISFLELEEKEKIVSMSDADKLSAYDYEKSKLLTLFSTKTIELQAAGMTFDDANAQAVSEYGDILQKLKDKYSQV